MKETGTEEIFKIIMTKSFFKLMSDTKPQIQGPQRTPSRITPKNMHFSISFKLQKTRNKEKILGEKQKEKKHLNYRGIRIRITEM